MRLLEAPWTFPDVLRGLCLFMAAWVLVFPASWRTGFDAAHAARLQSALTAPVPVPPDTLTKLTGDPVARFCHVLTSSAWSLLAAAQLDPTLRRRRPALHRRLGYAFFLSGLVVMVGYLSMERSGKVDYGPHNAWARPLLRTSAAWFVLTAGLALRSAVRRRFDDHRRWVLRHLSSGLWVAVQRLLVGPLFMPLHFVGLADFSDTGPPGAKVTGFVAASVLAAALTLAACEVHLAGAAGASPLVDAGPSRGRHSDGGRRNGGGMREAAQSKAKGE